ncbi:MAG: C40 family peptidase [Parasporobacterium sp.]|nr:C40 family peptidase [Parasporobacterium sp.]
MAEPEREAAFLEDPERAAKETAKELARIALTHHVSAAGTALTQSGHLLKAGILVSAAAIFLVLAVLIYPAALFFSSLGPVQKEDEYAAEYEHALQMSEAVIQRNYRYYSEDVAMVQAQRLKRSYENGSEITTYVLPGMDDLSVTASAGNRMMAAYHVAKYHNNADINDDEGYRYDFYGDEGKVDYYSSEEGGYALFKITGINPNVQAYEYVITPQRTYTEYEERIVEETVFTGSLADLLPEGHKATRTYVQKIPNEVVVPAVTQTRYRGTITVNVSFQTGNFMKEEFNEILKREGGSLIRSGSLTGDYEQATKTQKLICDLASGTPETEQGFCAQWVMNVINGTGLSRIGGNACDLWQEYCYSTDYTDLDVGMLIAVRSSAASELGEVYGHVGIYIGGGKVMDCTGQVCVTGLEDWIGKYDRLGTAAWGYPPEIRALVEEEVKERDLLEAVRERREGQAEEDSSSSRTVSSARLRDALVRYAMSWVGVTPYVWAGTSLTDGTDCSGFISLVYGAFGIDLPTDSLAYQDLGTKIRKADLQPGDIIVYGNGDHVAIYAGEGEVIHCSSPENGTVKWELGYRPDLSACIRVIEDGKEYEISENLSAFSDPAASSSVTKALQEEIRDVAETLLLEFGLKGKDVFPTYDLPDNALEGIALYCYRQAGTLQGAAMEASYMANCFELYGAEYGTGTEGFLSYVLSSGNFLSGELPGDPEAVPLKAAEVVRKVLVEGYRTLPGYVDRKEAFHKNYTADLMGTAIDAENKSLYRKFLTNIHPLPDPKDLNRNVPDPWTFYCFAPLTSDLFGYSSEQIREKKEEAFFAYGTWVYMGDLPEEADLSGLREQIVQYAMSWVGITPYVEWWNRLDAGGNIQNSLTQGTDCSGFISLVYEHFGYSLSKASDDYQDRVGERITQAELQPGDIIVYGSGSHVSIYAGDGKVVHCSNPKDGTVCWDRSYRSDETAYVRVIEEGDEFSFDSFFFGNLAGEGEELTQSQAEELYLTMALPSKSQVADLLTSYLSGDHDLVVCAIAWMEGEADYTADPYLGYLSASCILNSMLDAPSLYRNGACWATLRGWGAWYSKERLFTRYQNAGMASSFKCLYLAMKYPCRSVHSCFGVDLAYEAYGMTRESAVYVSSIITSEGQMTGVWR